jgi:hypothetical protein
MLFLDDGRGRATASDHHQEHRLTAAAAVVHLGRVRSTLIRGVLLLGEVVAVPGVLLYACVVSGHPMLGLMAVFVWRSACIGARVGAGARVPTTCWFAFGLFLTRTIAGLAVGSVGLYLLIPAALCAAQGIFFLASSLAERPVMMRLAADYATEVPDHPALRRLFGQLSGIWGGVHLACALLGAWALTLATPQAIALTSMLGFVCTVASVGGCIGWGLRRTARTPGLRIAYGEKHVVPASSDSRRDIALEPAA